MLKFTEVQKETFCKALNIFLNKNVSFCSDKEKLNDLSKSIELGYELTNKQIALLIELINWNIENRDILLKNDQNFKNKKEVDEFIQSLESIVE